MNKEAVGADVGRVLPKAHLHGASGQHDGRTDHNTDTKLQYFETPLSPLLPVGTGGSRGGPTQPENISAPYLVGLFSAGEGSLRCVA